MNISINVNTTPFVVGMGKCRIHMMPMSYQLHKDLHQRITARG